MSDFVLAGDLAAADGGLATEDAAIQGSLAAAVGRAAAQVLGRSPKDLPWDKPLGSLGLDSLGAFELAAQLQSELSHVVPLPDLLPDILPDLLAGKTLGALLEELTAMAAGAVPGIKSGAAPAHAPTAAASEPEAPLSHGQQALWYLRQLAPASGAYHLAAAARICGEVDALRLATAFHILIDRHPALRTIFLPRMEGPVQQVLDGNALAYAEWAAAEWSGEQLAGHLAQEAAKPFALDVEPPVRARLARGSGAGHVLLLVLHHIAADFWSLAVLADELGRLYGSLRAGPLAARAAVGPPPPTPAMHARRERERLAGTEGERLWHYWREQLAGAPLQLDLPTDRPRPSTQSFRGGRVRSALAPSATAGLLALGRGLEATPFTALLACFASLLHRVAAQRDLLVGVPAGGRESVALAGAVGYYVSPLAIRSRQGSGAFSRHLTDLRQTLRAGLAHQGYPLPLLAQRLQPVREPGRPPLLQAMLVLYQAPAFAPAGIAGFALGEPGARVQLGELTLECLPLPALGSQLDLTLSAALLGDRLALALEYDSDLFDAVTARRLLAQLETLAAAAVAEPDRPAELLPLLAGSEIHQLVREWNATECDEPRDLCLHQLVARQAARAPAAPAVVCGADRLTYAELDASAERLAAHLRGFGIGPETRAAVFVERSLEMVIGLLAVLKAGGAYVPLDPGYPPARLALMTASSRPRVVLLQARLRSRLPPCPGARLVDLDGRWWERALPAAPSPAAAAVSGNLAYVLYTSGSTGLPKPVAIEHRSAAALCAWAGVAFTAAELSGVLAGTSICFDLSVFEVFAPLTHGGTAILVRDVLALVETEALPTSAPVSLVNTVPSAMAELLRAGALPASASTVALAGEALHGALVREVYSRSSVRRVLNLYGPSEDTTYSTWASLTGDEQRPAIGRPLRNRMAFVLDACLRPVPIGAAGELFVTGAGLARGYFEQPDETARRFLPDPVSGAPGNRLYRTGDLARHLPDGRIDFLGRMDSQIKLHGFRIELGEIDARLAEHPRVGEAATILGAGAGGPRLIAYLAPRRPGKVPQAAELDAFLRARLPAKAVPSCFVALDALPRTPGGKLDRRRLPAPDGPEPGTGAPRSPVEEILAALWCQTLDLDRVGIHDDFFALGGHSLLAARLVARVRQTLGVDLPLSAVLEAPTVALLAERLAAPQNRAAAAAPGHRPRPAMPPLSAAQRRLWFLDRLAPGRAVYNLPYAVRLRGAVDPPQLARALDEIRRRHESLRTSFDETSGQPWQRIAPPAKAALRLIDLAAIAAPEPRARALAHAEAARRLDLATGPLLRCSLLRLSREDHLLVVVVHHAAADARSIEIFLDELAALYGAFASRRASPLPEPPLQYADYACGEATRLAPQARAAQRTYWARRLAGVTALELPADRPRPPRWEPRGAVALGEVGAAAWSGLRRLSRRGGATPFMAMLAAWAALLHRLTGAEDLVVGAPIAVRERQELEQVIGLFVNTLALRIAARREQSGEELLAGVRQTCLEAYAHRDLPFDAVVEAVRPGRGLSHNPLFDVMLAATPLPAARRAAGLTLAAEMLPTGSARLDLALFAGERPDSVELALELDRGRFDRATAVRLLRQLESLAAAMAATPSMPLGELPLLAAGQRHQLLVEWNDGAGGAAPNGCLHELVETQARRTPAAPAVVSAAGTLTYGELDRQATALARRLLSLGVGPEMRVGVFLPRSPELVVAILGVLKAGGAYLPLDPAYPEPRLRFALADASARLVVTCDELAGRLPAAGVLAVPVAGDGDAGGDGPTNAAGRTGSGALPPAPAAARACPDNLAYVIYTSGSTGRPKGVAICHRSAAALVSWAGAAFSAAECAAVLGSTSICFDLSVFELFVPLSRGGRVVLARDALELPSLAAPVTLVNTVPSVLAEVLREGGLPASVRTVCLAGEAPQSSLVARLHQLPGSRRCLNLYGPSEDTTYSTWADLGNLAAGPPPIGRPLPGTSALVLDSRLAPVPPGVTGEIYLGGTGLARGYLGRPELTAERFIPSPFHGEAGARLYRTGDVARQRPDGVLEFMGRADRQIKIRGFRIEPAEVEAALLAHPGVRQAAVVARAEPAGELNLVAYVVGSEPAPPMPATLRAFLRQRLPEPFIPALFLPLAALPRTPSGKLDRGALPPPPARTAPPAGRDRLPAGPAEEVLAAIWNEVLGGDPHGPDDDFFELGGHSLLAAQVLARVQAALGVTLPLSSAFELPTRAGLAARIEELRRHGPPSSREPLIRGDGGGSAPLSSAQRRLWFLAELEPQSPAYHIAGAARLQGALRTAALAAALAAVVRRQAMLRTAFLPGETGPVQRAVEDLAVALPMVDLRRAPAGRRAAEAARLSRRLARRRFDLAAGPPLRMALLRSAEEEHVLLATIHHLAADGWSLSILWRELAICYQAGLESATPLLPDLPVSYADYARWQQRRLDSDDTRRDLAYWTRQLSGSLPVLELPADRPRPLVRGDAGRRRAFAMPSHLAASLGAAASRHAVSPFMILLAAFMCLLRRLAREEDLLVGTPVANRGSLEIEGLVGCFVNTLVLRARLAAGLTFVELLAQVRDVTLAAFDHQGLPFERLVEELRPGRDLAHTALFQVLFVLQSARQAVSLPGLTLAEEEVDTGTAKFDLTLACEPRATGPLAIFEYASDLFDAATIVRLAGHFNSLLLGALAQPGCRCADLRWLDEAERHQILLAWNDTRIEAPPRLLHELFALQAERTPDAVAVAGAGGCLCYGELAARSDRLARRLRALAVGADAVVGICTERSPETIVGLLGILKAGAAYLPLDPGLPRTRLAQIAAEARSPLVLTQERLLPVLPQDLPAICLDRDDGADGTPGLGERHAAVQPDGLAYVIYTSGSTGRPKGVMNTHRAISNRLLWMQSAYGMTPADAVLQKTPYGFDVSVWEVFWPLMVGARLVQAAPDGHRDAGYLHQLVAHEGVTIVHFVPPMLQAFLDQPELTACSSLRLVVCSGEALPEPLAHRCQHDLACRIENLYGPTEAAVDVTAWRCRPQAAGATVPIGRAIDNVRILLLDDDGSPVPIGVPGELHIGGVALARGYLARPDLTAERFVPDVFSSEAGARLYHTGDLARYRPGGEIEFLGRLDHQVKIRGVRVEPQEIEAALLELADVRAAVVAAVDAPHGGRRLVAYVVPAAAPGPAAATLRAALRERLPEPMVPAAFVTLTELPLGPNGKVDRRSLPAPAPSAAAVRAPRTAIETRLAAIWAELLGVDAIGVDDNFFELGGHSLLATQLLSRIRDHFHVRLHLREIFAAPTIGELAGVVARRIVELAGMEAAAQLLAEVELATAASSPAAGSQAG
jgi:amino acid adenylation domain-containing protein